MTDDTETKDHDGELLATFQRGSSMSERPDRLYVAVREYRGLRHLDMRLWSHDAHRGWLPTKKGCHIRPRELAEFADAVAKAREILKDEP